MSKQKTNVYIESELRVKELLAERKILMKYFADMIGVKRESMIRSLKGNPQYGHSRYPKSVDSRIVQDP